MPTSPISSVSNGPSKDVQVEAFIKEFDLLVTDFHKKLYDLKVDFMKQVSEIRKRNDLRRAQEVLNSVKKSNV